MSPLAWRCFLCSTASERAPEIPAREWGQLLYFAQPGVLSCGLVGEGKFCIALCRASPGVEIRTRERSGGPVVCEGRLTEVSGNAGSIPRGRAVSLLEDYLPRIFHRGGLCRTAGGLLAPAGRATHADAGAGRAQSDSRASHHCSARPHP